MSAHLRTSTSSASEIPAWPRLASPRSHGFPTAMMIARWRKSRARPPFILHLRRRPDAPPPLIPYGDRRMPASGVPRDLAIARSRLDRKCGLCVTRKESLVDSSRATIASKIASIIALMDRVDPLMRFLLHCRDLSRQVPPRSWRESVRKSTSAFAPAPQR